MSCCFGDAHQAFYVTYSGPATGFKKFRSGPFRTAREALNYGAQRYGGMAPHVGHIEVHDQAGRLVIIT